MSLDTSGCLLEGIRVATGNSPFTFPPRTYVTDQTALDNSESLGRAEYMLFVAGQTAGTKGIEIADPNLSILWCRNNATVTRFDYDMFSRRWNTLPGGPPFNIGTFGNSPALVAPIPDQTVSPAEAPYYIFIGIPRQTVFTVQIVESNADFTNPPAGTVQIALSTGNLNFGTVDLANASYKGQSVYVSQQAFFPRSQSKGIIGQLPLSGAESYFLYLNPIPGTGQTPRIRIRYEPYLTPIPYATEASMIAPPAGSVAWAQDTGRVLFAAADIVANPGTNVYYDGVTLGKLTFTRTLVGIINGTSTFYPNPIGVNSLFANTSLDSSRYIFFAEPVNAPRYYFTVVLGNSSQGGLSGPSQGQILIDVSNGNICINQTDAQNLNGLVLWFIDGVLNMERGVAVQFYRSGVNGGGPEQTPDFTDLYLVQNQVIQAGMTASPFVMLPTIPLQDSQLAFAVQQATGGGTFTGPLVDATDPTQQALGYALDLDNKQVKFTIRKTITQTLEAATSSIKLTDSAVLADGFEVTRQLPGQTSPAPLTPNIDFNFDPNAGTLDFLQPVGEDDPNNILNIAGTVTLPNTFVAPTANFTSSNVGMFLLVSQGPNVNLYSIIGVQNSHTLLVDPPFVSAGATNADVRANREIIADRFFAAFNPPLRTFTLSKAKSVNGLFTALDPSQFSVFINTGQVNLTTPAQPGDVYKISYIWQQSPDNGVTVTPTPVTELAAFKIRQETATFVPGTSVITFNPNGNTVQTGQGITLYIDGVTQDPTSFNFMAPGTLSYNQILTSSNVVVLDYYVAEAPGGNTNFSLVNSPISVDYPQISAGATSATFNGNQTSILQKGGAFLVNKIDIVMIGDVTYNASSDTTTVRFNFAPCNYTNGQPGSAPTAVQFCAPIAGSNAPTYMVTETNAVDMLANNTNVLSISNDVTASYQQNTIVLIDGDPYLILSSTYDPTQNVSSVTLADKALRNYIISSLQHTVRPVGQAGTAFQTSETATLTFPLTLVQGGTSPAVLRQGIDYTVADGGTITLNKAIGYGSTLSVLYVARSSQPTGTQFSFNYACLIVPSQSNGMLGQNLAESYDLYSPDTFFYNVETIVSYIPIVTALLQQTATSSSGPNIQSQSSPATKDQGTQSLYWLEQHLGNEDIVVQRLLFFYNTLINNYEDILGDLDGRVVGGLSGKFRYSGESNVVTTYAQITNDIDDKIVLYSNLQLTSFGPPLVFQEVPVYGYMYEPNSLSRIYPTADPFVTVALNGQTQFSLVPFYFGTTIGSTNINNLTSVSTTKGSAAYSPVVSAVGSGGNTTAVVTTNGDTSNLIPMFATGKKVQFYNPDGSPNGAEGTISSISGPDTNNNWTLVVSGTSITMQKGGVSIDTGQSGPYYVPGRDFSVNNDDGTFHNSALPPPFNSGQTTVNGNELVDCSVTFVNSDTTPRRIPVLDGKLTNDDGRLPNPPVNRIGEADYLGYEITALSLIGFGGVAGGTTVFAVSPNPYAQPSVGQTVVFIDGPNVGQRSVVATIVGPTSFTVSPAFALNDAIGHDYYIIDFVAGDINKIVDGELEVLSVNTQLDPISPQLIGTVNSELVSIDIAIRSYGQQQAANSTATPSSATVLNDPSANFSTAEPPITSGSYLYVTSGPNQGLYAIASLTNTTVTINPGSPFPAAFPSLSANSPYIIFQPWSFLSSPEFQFASSFLASTLQFYQQTQAWQTTITAANAQNRLPIVQTRQTALTGFIQALESLLGSGDNLYNARYLWIQQRTDKQSGLLVQQVQAMAQRIINTANLVANQQKLLIIQSLPT
jgi:hypothetical protein